jgi:CHAT domain-containing protein
MVSTLFDRFPESHHYLSMLGVEWLEGGRADQLETMLLDLRRAPRSPLFRLNVRHEYLKLLHQQGRHPEAIEEERLAEAEASREPPGVRLTYYLLLRWFHVALLRAQAADSAVQRHARETAEWGRQQQLALVAQADPVTRLDFMLREATGLLDDGALDASVQAFTTLAQLADSLENRAALAQILVRRGRALVKLGRNLEAEGDLLAGRDAARQAGHLQWEYEAEHNLLHLYEGQREDAKAQAAGEAFARLTAQSGAAPVQMMADRDLAWFFQRLGKREPARRHFEAMLVAMDSLGPDEHYYAGEYFELIGDLEQAEAAFRRSSGLSDIRALGGLVRLAEATGDLERALVHAQFHDEVLRSSGYPEATPLLPALLARIGRVEEALAAAGTAREELRRRGQVAAAARLGADRAELLLRKAEWAEAASLGDSVMREATAVASTDTRLRATAIGGLARVRLGGTDRRLGRTQLDEAIREADKGQLTLLLVPLLEYSAEAAEVLGEAGRAFALLTRAAQLTDSVATSLSSDGPRAGYRSMQLHLSNRAIDLALRAGSAEHHAEWSVRRKGRGVLDRSFPRGAPRGPLLRALRSRLGPRRAVVDYVVLDTAVAGLVLTSDGATLHRLPVTADSLAVRVRRLVGRLTPRLGDAVDTLHSSFDGALAERLFRDLIEPLERDIGVRTKLTIVADGPLHQLPFDALMRPPAPTLTASGSAPGEFLVDRFTVDLAPSLAAVGHGDEVALRTSGTVAVVIGPMGRTAGSDMVRERETVVRAFPRGGVVRLEGSGATESAVRERAGSLRLLHIAAHARANDAEPGSARVALTPAGTDDGRLHAFEIDRLRFPGTLVVLSACETGAGRLVGGEGVMSLSRAFLRAGARGTVATLWPVGPPSSELMAHFYPRLAAGEPPAEALRNAKLELRRGQWASPLFWAPFVLVTQAP